MRLCFLRCGLFVPRLGEGGGLGRNALILPLRLDSLDRVSEGVVALPGALRLVVQGGRAVLPEFLENLGVTPGQQELGQLIVVSQRAVRVELEEVRTVGLDEAPEALHVHLAHPLHGGVVALDVLGELRVVRLVLEVARQRLGLVADPGDVQAAPQGVHDLVEQLGPLLAQLDALADGGLGVLAQVLHQRLFVRDVKPTEGRLRSVSVPLVGGHESGVEVRVADEGQLQQLGGVVAQSALGGLGLLRHLVVEGGVLVFELVDALVLLAADLLEPLDVQSDGVDQEGHQTERSESGQANGDSRRSVRVQADEAPDEDDEGHDHQAGAGALLTLGGFRDKAPVFATHG